MGFVYINTVNWITVPAAIGDPLNEQGVTPRTLVQLGPSELASGDIVQAEIKVNKTISVFEMCVGINVFSNTFTFSPANTQSPLYYFMYTNPAGPTRFECPGFNLSSAPNSCSDPILSYKATETGSQ